MGFLKRNKFSNAWDVAMIYTPTDIGLAGGTHESMQVMGQPVLTAATGAAQQAFDDGLEPDDAVLFGKTYLIAMLAEKYPGRVKKEALRPTLEEMTSVLAAKYGGPRIQKLRHFTEAFAAHVGASIPTSGKRAEIVLVVGTRDGDPLATIDDPPVDEAINSFVGWTFLHARVKGLCEGILQKQPGPLTLFLTKRDGSVLANFEADPSRGMLSGLQQWQQFNDEAKRLVELDQPLGTIGIPKAIPPSDIPSV